jgi:hypothetical protein
MIKTKDRVNKRRCDHRPRVWIVLRPWHGETPLELPRYSIINFKNWVAVLFLLKPEQHKKYPCYLALITITLYHKTPISYMTLPEKFNVKEHPKRNTLYIITYNSRVSANFAPAYEYLSVGFRAWAKYKLITTWFKVIPEIQQLAALCSIAVRYRGLYLHRLALPCNFADTARCLKGTRCLRSHCNAA